MFNTQFAPKLAIAAALCTIGLFSAPAAFAKSVEVVVNDLDLSSADGRNTLNARIRKAAREVCRDQRPATGTRIASGVDSQCYAQALEDVNTHVAGLVARTNGSHLGG